jgi:WW domain-binding protein 4
MSEYWVSQAKHYCKICNVWIADNKPSRQFHENGAKHKEKVETQMRNKRDEKLHGARSEAELRKQLAEIDKAAKEAIQGDRAEAHGQDFYRVRL